MSLYRASIYALLFCTTSLNATSKHSSKVIFTENKGQIREESINFESKVLYSSEFKNMTVLFKAGGLTYVFKNQDSYSIDVKFVESNPQVRISPEVQLSSYSNYYHPHCKTGVLKVKHYQKIIYKEIFPNIDLVFYGLNGKLKYDFVVYPGGDFADIKLLYNTNEQIIQNSDGSIRTNTSKYFIKENKPFIYQISNTTEAVDSIQIDGEFRIDNQEVSFSIGNYDPALPLIIDPELLWSTYIGDFDLDYGESIATDNNYNVYVLINTRANNDLDNIIMKFDSSGTQLWSTAIGGTDEDEGMGLITNDSNQVFLIGHTASDDFPVQNAYQSSINGPRDMYLVKFNNDGSVDWATYYGGSGFDKSGDISIDNNQDLVIVGSTFSSDFPVSNDAFQNTIVGSQDGVVAKLDQSGNPIWATFIGGSNIDELAGVACDNNNNIIIGGSTESTDLVITFGVFQTSAAGETDMIMARFGSDGQNHWTTYYGGSLTESGGEVGVDNEGNAYMTGSTNSGNFPVSQGAFQSTKKANQEIFIFKLDTAGNQVWSTYVGGNKDDSAYDLTIDQNNNVFISGNSYSANFPVSNLTYQSNMAGVQDIIAMKFSKDGANIWSTYVGGTGGEHGHDIITDADNMVYLTGHVSSTDFPVSADAYQNFFSGDEDGFLLKFNNCGSNLEEPITVTGSKNFCEGDSVILTGPTGYNGYQWSNGETSISITIKISNTLYLTVVDSLECFGVSDEIIIRMYKRPQPVISITGSYPLCKGDTLNLDAGSDYASYLWSNNLTTQQITVIDSGKFYVVVTESYGCATASDTIDVVVNNLPASPSITLNDTAQFCDGDSVALDAGNGYDFYLWSNGSTSQLIIVKESGNYTVVVSDSNDCKATSTAQTIVVYPDFNIDTSGPSTFCMGDSVLLSVDSIYVNYIWSTGDSSTFILVKDSGLYSIIVDDSNGCRGLRAINIIVNPNPVVLIISSSTEICYGDSVSIIANIENSNVWSPSNGLLCQNCDTTIASPEQTTIYTVISTNMYDCAKQDSILLVVNKNPDFDIIKKDTLSGICEGDSMILAVETNYQSYYWSTGEIEDTTLIYKEGKYFVTVEDTNGCTSTDSIKINGIKKPIANLGADTLVCSLDYLRLTPENSGDVTLWSTGNNKNEIIVSESGWYWVTTMNECGYDKDSIEVTFYSQSIDSIFIPNVFTPNGDDINDDFKIWMQKEVPVDNFELNLYNRWGMRVFTSKETTGKWGGRHNGQEVLSGVYFCTLKYTNCKNEPIQLSRTVTLIR